MGMTPAVRRWRRLRRWLLTAIACVIVGAAGLIAVGRLLVPWLVDSPPAVAAWLGQRIGHAVELDSVSAHWAGPGPVLELGGLRISAAAGDPAAISLGRARVQVDIYALLLPGRHLIRDFLLVDARVELVRETDGRLLIEGFGGGKGGDLSSWLGRVGHIGLSGGQLGLVDRASGREFVLENVELRLSQHGERLTVGLERDSQDRRGRLRAVLEHQGPLRWPIRDAELYVEAEQFPVAEMTGLSEPFGLGLRDGVLNGRQWLTWRQQHLTGLQGDWGVDGLVLAAPSFDWLDAGAVEPHLHLPHGRVALSGSEDANGFALDLRAGPGSEAASMVSELSASIDRSGNVRVAATELPLELLAAIGQLTQLTPAKLRAQLYSAQLRGVVRHLEVRRDVDDWQWFAGVDDIQAHAAAPHWPEVNGLSASLSGDAGGTVIQVDRDAMEFAIPGVLRAPIPLRALDLVAGVRHEASGWVAEVAQAHLDGTGFSADLALRIDVDPALGPILRGIAHVPGADVEAAKAFWVINKMPPHTVSWLDRALGVGRVDDGKVVFRGALKDWPFAAQQGRFEARFAVSGADLDYHADWPRAENLAAAGAFINSSLVVDSASGMLAGNRVVRGSGAIPSLKDPVLQLNLAGEGDAASWLQFLKSTPVQRSHGAVLFGMSMAGPADVDARITIPLRKDLGHGGVEGKAMLHGVTFRDTKWDLAFAEIRGRADFSDGGFAADHLTVTTEGEPAELSLAVGTFSSDPALAVEASMTGRLSAQALFGRHEPLATILSQISGSADWGVELKVHKDQQSGASAGTDVRYRSNLAGMAIAFPSPLGKPIDTALPVDLTVHLASEESIAPQLRLEIGDRARLLAELGTRDTDFRGQLQLGRPLAQDLPAKGLRVSGSSDAIDVSGWAGWVFASTATAADSSLADIDVTLGGAAQRLQLDRSDGPWVLRLTGPDAEGTVRFESAGDRPAAVVAQFERLYLPEPGDGDVDLAITPAMVPTLHLWARDLRVGASKLGEARLEAFASDQGLRVDLLEARSPDLEIHATGDWRANGGAAESRFKIRMVSEDLGRMLTGLGFAGVIAGGQTLAEIDASWRGAPYAFALDRLTGSIDVSVGQGRFLDVDPGAGRIFGLLSLRELPRRLTLDFRDLFQTGMSFDRIEGRFQIADGNAWTENLTVRGPAADILIIGRTGLASRDYDQQVMVAPHVSGVLPVLGGLAAGPVGAAAGFLAQGMVQQGGDIEKTSRVHYSIAGSWEKPVVARLTPVRPDAPPRRRVDAPAGAEG